MSEICVKIRIQKKRKDMRQPITIPINITMRIKLM